MTGSENCSADDLRSVRALHLLVPARFGGLEAPPVEFFRAIRDIAADSLPSAWLAASLGVNAWHVALFTDLAQQDVWHQDATPLIGAAHAPLGRLRRGSGGFRLSGHWDLGTTATGTDWVILATVGVDHDGRALDSYSVLVPRADLHATASPTVQDLSGAAALHLEADDVFVPEHRVVSTFAVSQLRAPGRIVNPGPLYALPWGLMLSYAATAPLLGAADGCYRVVVQEGRNLHRLSLGGSTSASGARLREALGRAATEIDAGVLQTERNLQELYSMALAGTPASQELRLRARRDQARAAQRAVEVVDLLFTAADHLSAAGRDHLERSWREVHLAGRHRANDVHLAFGHFGHLELGGHVEDDLH